MKVKIAVFDYCETLVNIQTGNDFLNSYIHQNKGIIVKTIAYFISYLRIFKPRRKALLLRLLSGQSLESIEKFAKFYASERLESEENRNVLEFMKKLKQEGYKLIILSAGYSVYIKAHNNKLKADMVIANDFQYINSIFTGRLTQQDCFGDVKLKRLKEAFINQKIDYENSYFFSDCVSDLPLFKSFGNSFLVTQQNIVPFSKK